MNRTLGVLLLIVWALCGHLPDARADEKQPRDLIRQKLAKPVTLPKETNTTIKDFVDELARQCGVSFVLDQAAFRADQQIDNINEQPMKLPRLTDVPLRAVLRLMLQQLEWAAGGYRVRDGYIEITTLQRVLLQSVANGEPPLRPLVDVEFVRRPLDEALRDLADQADINYLVDEAHIGDKGKTPVSATLENVPVDTAARLLSDMAGLQAVLADNVLYLTTRDKGKELQAELDRRLGWQQKLLKEVQNRPSFYGPTHPRRPQPGTKGQ
jgi:hypothetical protein